MCRRRCLLTMSRTRPMPIAPATLDIIRPRRSSGDKVRSAPALLEPAARTGKVLLADREEVPAEQPAQALATWIVISRTGSEADRKASGSAVSSGVARAVTVRAELGAAAFAGVKAVSKKICDANARSSHFARRAAPPGQDVIPRLHRHLERADAASTACAGLMKCARGFRAADLPPPLGRVIVGA